MTSFVLSTILMLGIIGAAGRWAQLKQRRPVGASDPEPEREEA